MMDAILKSDDVKLFIKQNRPPEMMNEMFLLACGKNAINIIKYIIQNHSPINLNYTNYSAAGFDVACRLNHINVIFYLIVLSSRQPYYKFNKINIYFDMRKGTGLALAYAIMNNNINLVIYLCSLGVFDKYDEYSEYSNATICKQIKKIII
jgi:hypothetical protein